jgi:hypothetical protein
VEVIMSTIDTTFRRILTTVALRLAAGCDRSHAPTADHGPSRRLLLATVLATLAAPR